MNTALKPVTTINELKQRFGKYVSMELSSENLPSMINVDQRSTSALGRQLFWKYNRNMKTDFGVVSSVWSGAMYCTTKGFPHSLLSVPTDKYTPAQKELVRNLKKVQVTNYWAIVTHLIGIRLLADKNLCEQLAATGDTKLTSYSAVNVTLFGKKLESKTNKPNLIHITNLLILAYYRALIQKSIFSIEAVMEFANAMRDDTNQDIYTEKVKSICIENATSIPKQNTETPVENTTVEASEDNAAE